LALKFALDTADEGVLSGSVVNDFLLLKLFLFVSWMVIGFLCLSAARPIWRSPPLLPRAKLSLLLGGVAYLASAFLVIDATLRPDINLVFISGALSALMVSYCLCFIAKGLSGSKIGLQYQEARAWLCVGIAGLVIAAGFFIFAADF
jgi:hypothetical protein